jgi:lipopolysaccharide export system protein LptC
MALQESWLEGSALADGLADRQQRRRAFQAARRHSRLVRRLRFLLPVAGVVAVVAFSVATRFALPGDLDLSVARMSVTRNAIIMDNPELTGFDSRDREYSLSADRAIQALARPNQVRLEDIKAKVTVAGRGTATVTAGAGDYDNAESTLKLFGGIEVDSSEGYALRMTDADIDFGGGTIASPNRVTLRFADSETTGGAISVTGGGQVIVMEGGVRTTLMPPKRPAAPLEPAGLSEE